MDTGTRDPDHELRRGPHDLAALRLSYARSTLGEADLAPDPFTQFQGWFDDAVAAGLTEPNAMVLATAMPLSGDVPAAAPSARTVLLKGVDHGFVLYTNRGSRKGREMRQNPSASLVFPWFAMDRQVVVVGAVEEVDRETTETYFRSRPHESQLGAWVSAQSTVIGDRRALEEEYAELVRRWAPGQVPLPDHWGGFRVVPETVEFWQGRVSRLHDRLRYVRVASGQGTSWRTERLAP
ncbi:MAG: pyridoxamine 5-phosphate oxidase [Actinotalea sp.]|nr:pyridoxamine 5-phosphate oxidase [Actinotalea sp.]